MEVGNEGPISILLGKRIVRPHSQRLTVPLFPLDVNVFHVIVDCLGHTFAMRFYQHAFF